MTGGCFLLKEENREIIIGLELAQLCWIMDRLNIEVWVKLARGAGEGDLDDSHINQCGWRR